MVLRLSGKGPFGKERSTTNHTDKLFLSSYYIYNPSMLLLPRKSPKTTQSSPKKTKPPPPIPPTIPYPATEENREKLKQHLLSHYIDDQPTGHPHRLSLTHTCPTTLVDAWNGYHSVPLHPDDRHFTTFITPWGRYRYRTAPQGYIASGDGYSRRYDEIVFTVPDKTKCVDDTLLWSDTIEESYFQAARWLDICGRHRITLNPDKIISICLG